MLCTTTGGANARPFHTHLNAKNMDLKLRISPELFLKQLVIGGFDKVYEIGRQFRNEGMDATHNPEFTTLEFYQAYSDYYQLMEITETMLSQLVLSITGSLKVPYAMSTKSGSEPTIVEIDFTPPFRRISYMKELEKKLGRKIPEESDEEIQGEAGSSATRELLDIIDSVPDISKFNGPRTYARLLDHLASHFLESECVQPTFLCDHPIGISPLAKRHRDNVGKGGKEKPTEWFKIGSQKLTNLQPRVTERFELFIARKEFCNAYSELNDPVDQRWRFLQQQRDRTEMGDIEAQETDEVFCKALEYGLPPTGGWGLGIDRLVMLLTNSRQIRDVLLFPTMKEANQNKQD